MSVVARQVVHWKPGGKRTGRDHLAVEEPLEIRLDSAPLVVTMRTPGHDIELAAGHLFTERIVRSPGQLLEIKANRRNRSGNCIDVFLAPDVIVPLEKMKRRSFVSSSCGVCGKESIRAVRQLFRPVRAQFSVPAGLLLELPIRLSAAQPIFARTGGLHAAGIFTSAGELVAAREDIGRHNAVDKVVGYGFLNRLLPFDRHVLVVSGRASFEIMQKALAARIPIVCAVSAPSSLAVDFARSSGQTLIGFARADRMNVYTGRRRVRFD